MLKERQGLLNLEKQIANLKMEYEYQSTSVREREGVVKEYDRMIEESEKAYSKVHHSLILKYSSQPLSQLVENSSKLLRALESESTNLKGRIKPKV